MPVFHSTLRTVATIPVVLVVLAMQCRQTGHGQEQGNTRAVIRLIADGVIHDAAFSFVDPATGKGYATPGDAPAGTHLVPRSPYNDWRYWNGVLMMAMMRAGESLGDSSYGQFAFRNAAFCFEAAGWFKDHHENEGKWEYPFAQFFTMEELDDYGAMGGAMIEISVRDPQPRYREYLGRALDYLLHHQGRLTDGTLARTFPRRWTLWADDLYMSVTFLARMGTLTNDARCFDDGITQVLNMHRWLDDSATGVLHHFRYADSSRPGTALWGRANGWALLAEVDLLDHLPLHHPRRDSVLAIFRRHAAGLLRLQDSTGLWHQLLDKPDAYLETSCSAMFTYGFARGVARGYLPSSFAAPARKGWEGICSRIQPDGRITGVCAGTTTSDDLQYYFTRPTPLNDIHGIGAVLFAGTEILQIEN